MGKAVLHDGPYLRAAIDGLNAVRDGAVTNKSFELLVMRVPATDVTIDVLTDETVVVVGMDALVYVEIVVVTATAITSELTPTVSLEE